MVKCSTQCATCLRKKVVVWVEVVCSRFVCVRMCGIYPLNKAEQKDPTLGKGVLTPLDAP